MKEIKLRESCKISKRNRLKEEISGFFKLEHLIK